MQFSPGDILLFSGRGFLSELTKWTTNSVFSHVGLICQQGLFESQKLSNIPDISGINKKGVQIVNINDRIIFYEGNVYYRGIREKYLWDEGIFQGFKSLTHLKPFCPNFFRLLGCSFPINTKTNGWFCSELVAELFNRFGWINVDSSKVSPKDFVGKLDYLFESFIQLK